MIKHTEAVSPSFEGHFLHASRSDASVVGMTFQDCPVYGQPETTTRYFSNIVVYGVGRTVAVYHKEERIMSDVWDSVGYAVLYVPEDGSFETINLGCRSYNGDEFAAKIDAPDGMISLYLCHIAVREAEAKEAARLRDEACLAARIEAEAKAVRRGRQVRVVRGRKVPIGTVGECFWVGDSRYGQRVGIRVAGQADPVWCDARNCEAVA